MIVCVAANPSIDKLFVVDRVVHGAIHRPIDFVQVPGGKAFNVARAICALGGTAEALGIVGGHAGRWIATALAAEGVAGDFVWAESETRASLSVADRETGSLTEFYEAGPVVVGEQWSSFESMVAKRVSASSFVVLSGSLPPGAPVDGYARLLAITRAAGVPAAIDAHGEALALALCLHPAVMKINAAEAEGLLGITIEHPHDAAEAFEALRERGLAAAQAGIITLGTEGVVLSLPDGQMWLGAVDAQGPCGVGSGDAFLAGLVLALERDLAWPDALALGLGAAAANAEVGGPGRLCRERATALAGIARVDRLG